MDSTLVRGGGPRAVLLQLSGPRGEQGQEGGRSLPGISQGNRVAPLFRPAPAPPNIYKNILVGLGWHRRRKTFCIYWGWRWLATTL